MIISRYLTKQVVQATLALAFVLLLTVVVGRFLKYLAQASQGEIDPSVLALLMSYRLPEFIQLIIPLALMLGILLAYGRMYAESEMTVLIACGQSRRRLLGISLFSAGLFAAVVAVLALRVTPWGLVNTETLLGAQEELTEFDILVPGLFQNISRGERTTYTESMQDDRLSNVFMHEREENRVIAAQSALPAEDAQGNRFILFRDGSVAQGVSGEDRYVISRFDELGISVPRQDLDFELAVEEKAMSTLALLASAEPSHVAELQWRLSLVILIPILTLLAVSLSRVSPREGRFARLVPAILLYIAYFGLLLACRDLIAEGTLPPLVGMWWVHVLFLIIGLLLFFDKLRNPLHRLPPRLRPSGAAS